MQLVMNLQIDQDHLTTALGFFSFLGFSCFSGLASSSLLALLSSSLSFLRRVMVTLAVVATLVANSKAPPAKVVLHPLHAQMPAAVLLIWDLPQAGQTYLARCCNQNFLTIFLMEEPQRVPYFPVTPTFFVLLAIPQLKQYNIYINFHSHHCTMLLSFSLLQYCSQSLGVLGFGLPFFQSCPDLISSCLRLAWGPSFHLRGQVSRSMMTRLVLATTPWSHEPISAVVIWAMATATASPLVDIITISVPTLIPLSQRRMPGIISLAPQQIALMEESLITMRGSLRSRTSRGRTTRLRQVSSLQFSNLHWASSRSCMVTKWSFSDMQPLLDLRSSSICPPTPNSNPMWMQRVLTQVPASQETRKTPRRFSGSNSSNSDSQIVLIRSSLLTAEISGGFWKRLPVRVLRTFLSLASLSMGPCSLTMPMYYLPAVCWDLANLVALSRQTMRQPVTLGSRVPECPVFSTLRIFLTQETTSWELGLEGLSRLMTPYLRYSLMGLLRGVFPAGMGVQCVVRTFMRWQFLSSNGHYSDRMRAPSSDGRIMCSSSTIYSSTLASFSASLFFFLSEPIVEQSQLKIIVQSPAPNIELALIWAALQDDGEVLGISGFRKKWGQMGEDMALLDGYNTGISFASVSREQFQQLINIMEKGNTTFYHRHIQSNITQLDQRKDKFISHRLEFLKEYCEPIQERIDAIQRQIERYKMMRDTQEEVIENDPQILTVKKELNDYMHTHNYYEEKLNQYEKKSIDLDAYNQELIKKINSMRKEIKHHREDLGFRLPSIKQTRLKTLSFDREEKVGNRSLFLPDIKNQTEDAYSNSQSRSTKMQERRRIIGIGQKIQRKISPRSKELQQGQKTQQTPNQRQQKANAKQKNIELRQKITDFNRTQILFHQCFETKKAAVQKSVSQLQSKLITNRVQFLSTCQAIGSKQSKVPFEQFKRLSSDEIITLFISFVWLNRRLNGEFLKKRKQIMELITKLPKVE